MSQDRVCIFQCHSCRHKWKQAFAEYVENKADCPRCHSPYYTWTNYKPS